MTDPQRLNSQYYFDHAARYAESTYRVDMSEIYQTFIQNLPNDSQFILDVGCGSGRDSAYFNSLGYQVTAIDGSQRLINWAIDNNDGDITWKCMTFRQFSFQNWYNKYAGIWACASLLHMPYSQLPSLLNNFLSALTDDGVLYASFKYGDSEHVDKGRFFCDMNEIRTSKVIASLDNSITFKTWITEDKRVDGSDRWLNLVIKKS